MLSTTVTLSPIEKILLARAHRVGGWLDEALTNLATCNPVPSLEDLSTLGWETVARIFWIRDSLPPKSPNTLRFRRSAIKCASCSSSSSLIDDSYPQAGGCEHIVSGNAELTFSGSPSPMQGSLDFMVKLKEIKCVICEKSFVADVTCNGCRSKTYYYHSNVRVLTLSKLIEEMFGEEIKDYGPGRPSVIEPGIVCMSPRLWRADD